MHAKGDLIGDKITFTFNYFAGDREYDLEGDLEIVAVDGEDINQSDIPAELLDGLYVYVKRSMRRRGYNEKYRRKIPPLKRHRGRDFYV